MLLLAIFQTIQTIFLFSPWRHRNVLPFPVEVLGTQMTPRSPHSSLGLDEAVVASKHRIAMLCPSSHLFKIGPMLVGIQEERGKKINQMKNKTSSVI